MKPAHAPFTGTLKEEGDRIDLPDRLDDKTMKHTVRVALLSHRMKYKACYAEDDTPGRLLHQNHTRRLRESPLPVDREHASTRRSTVVNHPTAVY
jgi:hypothetical protein